MKKRIKQHKHDASMPEEDEEARSKTQWFNWQNVKRMSMKDCRLKELTDLKPSDDERNNPLRYDEDGFRSSDDEAEEINPINNNKLNGAGWQTDTFGDSRGNDLSTRVSSFLLVCIDDFLCASCRPRASMRQWGRLYVWRSVGMYDVRAVSARFASGGGHRSACSALASLDWNCCAGFVALHLYNGSIVLDLHAGGGRLKSWFFQIQLRYLFQSMLQNARNELYANFYSWKVSRSYKLLETFTLQKMW